MRTKAVIKKMAALGTGLAMMGASMMGALAADLGDYPGMFLMDNKFNAAIVVGDEAAASDVVGAIDLAASLQYSAREMKEVSLGGTTVVSASDGVEVSATGNHLTLGEALNAVEAQFKKGDLPVLLADGTIEDDSDGTDYDYDQKLEPAADVVVFDNPDDDVFGDLPGLYLDQSAGIAYTVTVDFDDAVNFTSFDDSEKLVMMGKTFTVDPDMVSTSTTLVLYASEKTETIAVGDTKTVILDDGTEIIVELVGANSDLGEATVRVNSKTYTKSAGQTVSVAGTQIYINDVFTYNIPAPGAAVEFFVGSDKVEIDGTGGFNDIEVDDDTLTGVEASVTSGDLEAVDEIVFRVTPSEFDANEARYLQIGEEFVDPLFKNFKMKFAGVTPELKDAAKTKISLTRSGDDYKLAFVNKDAQDYEFLLFSADATADDDLVDYHEDFLGADDNVTDDKLFILSEGDVTKVFKLLSVNTESGTMKANVRDLYDNSDFKVQVGDEIGDTGVSVSALGDGGTDWMDLDANTQLQITTQFDGLITITADPTDSNLYELNFTEGTDNFDDLSTTAEFAGLYINISDDSSDGDEDVTIVDLDYLDANDVDVKSDEDNDVEYGVTLFGTYWERERDNNGAYMDIYYPEEETSYHIFFMPLAGTTSTAAGGDVVTYYEYNKIEVGAAKLASEIADATAQNLIVVGGPCANKVAAALKGNPANCAEGFEEGKAILELVESGEYVALLVAGYSADDTRRATSVLANYEDYTLSGTSMVVTGTSLTDITVSAPTP